MIKILLVLIVSFTAGFFVHALVFPDKFSQTPNIEATKQKILGEQSSNKLDSTETNPSLKIVEYKDGKFSPSKIYIQQGYYVAIRNMDEDEYMWLLSEDKDLTTVRNYALSEEVKKRMDKKGTYVVYEKNSQSPLTIVVK